MSGDGGRWTRSTEELLMNIFVLGGSASIGREVVRECVADAHRVVATYNSNPPDDELGAAWMQLDLRGVLPDLNEAGPEIDAVVLLPSIVRNQALDAYDDEMIAELVNVNFAGQVRFIRDVTPLLSHGSQIIIVGSIAAQRGSIDPIYGATKGAMHALAKSLSKGLAPKTRVNVVAPGLVAETAMYEAATEEFRARRITLTPTNRLVTPTELARVIVDLLKPHWAQLNGACIDLNGGEYAR
jgi:NAD(P)-dependent dehydrogenase (short-subunit alcohol dehydrogenase family)